MKKVLALLLWSTILINAQVTKPIVVWCDIDFADTTIDGTIEKNIPVFSSQDKIMIDQLFEIIRSKNYYAFYRFNLKPTTLSLNFPTLFRDSVLYVDPFPPYSERLEVFQQNIGIENIEKIRIYELWDFDKWDLNQKGYNRKVIGWSFILRPFISIGLEGDTGYSFNQMLSPWAPRIANNFEPYIFLSDPKDIGYLKKAVNNYDEKKHLTHYPFEHNADPPRSHGQLLVYDVYFPDTIKQWEDDSLTEAEPYRWDKPFNTKSYIDQLFSQIKAGKYYQYDFYQSEILDETSGFPLLRIDSTQVQMPYPPYQFYDTVVVSNVDWNKIVGIRYFEQIDPSSVSIKSPVSKKLMGWTFLILDVFNSEVPNAFPCFYIFVTDKKYVPFLKQKLKR